MEEVNDMLTVNLFRSFVIFNVLDLYHSWEAKLEVAPVVSIVWNSSRLPVPETLFLIAFQENIQVWKCQNSLQDWHAITWLVASHI